MYKRNVHFNDIQSDNAFQNDRNILSKCMHMFKDKKQKQKKKQFSDALSGWCVSVFQLELQIATKQMANLLCITIDKQNIYLKIT